MAISMLCTGKNTTPELRETVCIVRGQVKSFVPLPGSISSFLDSVHNINQHLQEVFHQILFSMNDPSITRCVAGRQAGRQTPSVVFGRQRPCFCDRFNGRMMKRNRELIYIPLFRRRRRFSVQIGRKTVHKLMLIISTILFIKIL